MGLPTCWEIKGCGREAGGAKSAELGVCPAYPKFGHSCWAITGTLCGGKVQGTFAEKQKNCMTCDLYKNYNRTTGTQINQLKLQHAGEIDEFREVLRDRSRERA